MSTSKSVCIVRPQPKSQGRHPELTVSDLPQRLCYWDSTLRLPILEAFSHWWPPWIRRMTVEQSSLLFQTSMRQVWKAAKFGPKQGTKQRIPPPFIHNWGIPRTFWVATYKNTPFGFRIHNPKVDNKPENSDKPIFLMPSFECCTKQQCTTSLQVPREYKY